MKLEAIHPAYRRTARPTPGERIKANPPSLLWPITKGEDIRYMVRLSPTTHFPTAATIEAHDLPWAMFNPHRRLAAGTWYWQYGVSEGGSEVRWSDVMRFEVPWYVDAGTTSRVFDTPTAEELMLSVPKTHPRVLALPDELPGLRQKLREMGVIPQLRKDTEAYYLGHELPPDEVPEKWAKMGDDEFEQQKYVGWVSKGLGETIKEGLDYLLHLYLATGEERYGREAVRWALHAAGWDPDGLTSWRPAARWRLTECRLCRIMTVCAWGWRVGGISVIDSRGVCSLRAYAFPFGKDIGGVKGSVLQ